MYTGRYEEVDLVQCWHSQQTAMSAVQSGWRITYGENNSMRRSVKGESETGRDGFAIVLYRVGLSHRELEVNHEPTSILARLTPMEKDQ
jgi:hypothetical protein